jgi:ATPase
MKRKQKADKADSMKEASMKANTMASAKAKTIVPDTSVLINGELSRLIKTGSLKGARIVIPRTVLDELTAQASRGKDTGFEGLEEIKSIRELGGKKGVSVEFTGERPTLEEIQLARKGRLDAIIKDHANKVNGTLLTSDYVQALVSEAEGVPVRYIRQELSSGPIEIESFFTKDTQSVHLKQGSRAMAKKGKPGQVELVTIGKEKLSEKDLKAIEQEIFSKVRVDQDSFIEIGKRGAMVVQMGQYRIAITRPPFSDSMEITAVRPVAKLSLSDYNLHKDLEMKIIEGSHGVLIAGPPGSGKSTFAASIADFLTERSKIVKTFEQPRDLQVGPDVTQYAPLEGDWEKTSELLLLVRPDYTIFDEIRRTKDFKVFGDMRLAGVGMVGVMHATNPVSAIQRFIGRMELGTIPHVMDTVIYINAGRIEKIYEISMVVRVPTGMKDADLARPIVEVREFSTKNLEFEIYTYGEENVIIPVKKEQESPLRKLAMEKIRSELRRYDPDMGIEFSSDNRVILKVRNSAIGKMIGKKGSNIEVLEKRLGISISVEPKEGSMKDEAMAATSETGAFINVMVEHGLAGSSVDVYSGDEYLFSAHVGKNGLIRVRKKSDLGRKLLRAIVTRNLRVLV